MLQNPNDLIAIPCPNVGTALDTLRLARECCCRASYHPAGGDTCKQYTPITHTVWVMGSQEQVQKFALEFNLRRNYDTHPKETTPLPQA